MTNLPLVSTVPAVIDALVTAFGTVSSDVAYGPLEVNDGPKAQTSAKNMIAVGVGDPAVPGTDTPQGRGSAVDQSYDIHCLMWAWSGSKVIKQHRDRVYAMLAEIRAIVDAQPLDPIFTRLGTSWSLTPSVSGEGGSCSYQFSIHVVASI